MPKPIKEGLEQTSVFDVSTRYVNRAEGKVKVASIDIEGPIGFDFEKYWAGESMNDASTIKEKLNEIGQDVTEIKVNILNSPGGDVYDGLAIHDFLAAHPAKVVTEVIGFAASISTVIWQAGNERRMSSNSSVLLHKAMIGMCGFFNEDELESAKDDIARLSSRTMSLYERRGVNMEKAAPYINANIGNGTWIYPEEAKDMGLVDKVFEPFKAVAFKSMTETSYKAMKSMFGLPEYPKMNVTKEPEQADNNNDKEESTMTPEEIQALVTNAVIAAVAAFKPQETAPETPKPQEPKVSPKMEVTFEGDFDNQEHIEAHAVKLKKAQLYNATDFNDIDSVMKYQAALKKLTDGGAGQAPKVAFSSNALNPTPVTDPQSSRDTDLADTLVAMGITLEGGK